MPAIWRGIVSGTSRLHWRNEQVKHGVGARAAFMYQIDAVAALRQTARTLRGRPSWPHVSRNVVALGFTSLLTDVSSEMVATVLPIYLVLYLGLTPLQFGLVDGLYHGMTALLRLAGGFASDRTRRDKEVAAVGYGTSALCRIGLLGAGGAWPLIAAIVAVDRAAKGLRAAPRDALISLSSGRAGLATSFGVHRALDSAGAMLGPLLALAILSAAPDAYDLVFVTSFAVAVVGFGVLWLFVRSARGLALGRKESLRPRRALPLPAGDAGVRRTDLRRGAAQPGDRQRRLPLSRPAATHRAEPRAVSAAVRRDRGLLPAARSPRRDARGPLRPPDHVPCRTRGAAAGVPDRRSRRGVPLPIWRYASCCWVAIMR